MNRVFQILIIFGLLSDPVSGSAAITLPQAPENGQQVVRDNLAPMLRHDPKLFNGATNLVAGQAHRVYSVAMTNLADGKLLSTARAGAWRYLLMNGTNIAGEATLSENDQGTLTFDGASSTRFAPKTLDAIRHAETSGRLKDQPYEMRYLDIPSVHFVGVWFHSEADDLIIPLLPMWNRMKAYQLCSEDEILQLLKPEAQRVARIDAEAQDDRPGDRQAAMAVVLSRFDESAPPLSDRPDTEVGRHAGVSLGLGLCF